MVFVVRFVSGSRTGEEITVRERQALRVGRGVPSHVIVPDDPELSETHFELWLADDVCSIRDLHSTNGLFVNGVRVDEAVLQEGDTIGAGTLELIAAGFRDDEPLQESGQTLGRWELTFVPAAWEKVENDAALRRSGEGVFPSNVVATEDQLADGRTLDEYVNTQVQLLQAYVPDARTDRVRSDAVRGAEETIAMDLRYASGDGKKVAQRQVYARSGETVAVLTFTTLEEEMLDLQPVFESMIAKAALRAT